MNRIEKLRRFLIEHGYEGVQTFDSRNTIGDKMVTIYDCDGIIVDHCSHWRYLEIFGLSKKEYRGLSDILNIC